MIRRFTSAQIVPANAGAKAKNPVSSTLFSTPMVALLGDTPLSFFGYAWTPWISKLLVPGALVMTNYPPRR